jgi:hypothetical protein
MIVGIPARSWDGNTVVGNSIVGWAANEEFRTAASATFCTATTFDVPYIAVGY